MQSHRFFVGACCDVDARAELAIDLNPDAQRFVGGKLGIKGGPALLMNAELAAKLLPQRFRWDVLMSGTLRRDS